jgi:hypothetical protein
MDDTKKTALSKEKFRKILDLIEQQVFEGKGKERHGHGDNFHDQPWVHITQNVGTGFVLGQAMKKLMELRTFEPGSAQWEREALGSAVYIIMAMLWERYKIDVIS